MLSRRRRTALLAIAAVILLLTGGRMAAAWLVDLLWYRSLGMEQVFWTRWSTGTVVRASAGVVLGALVFANLWAVAGTLGAIRVRRRYGNIEIAERLPRGYVLGAVVALSALSGWWLSGGMPDALATRAALRHVAWGARDPVFGLDLSFYVFVLPVLDQLQILTGLLIFWTALLVLAAYMGTGAIRAQQGSVTALPRARRHLGLLAASLFVVVAWDLALDRYAILFAGRGVGGAMGYTDVHARLPGLSISALLALATAVMVGVAAWRNRRRLAVLSVGALVAVMVLARVVVPSLLQKLVVEPNEFPRERTFLEQHLRAARSAYGLDSLSRVPLPFQTRASPDRETALRALAEAPLWDPRPLLQAFNQRESLRRYFEFRSALADRYDGRQVAVAVRELNPMELPEGARTWQNLRLRYVAGEGAVVSPAAQMSEDGSPAYFLNDLNPPKLDPQAPRELALSEPRVFFGEATDDYILTGADAPAIGIPLRTFWNRLTFAWAFQSRNLLLSGSVTTDSRFVHRRNIFERVAAVAPFVRFLPEQHAQPVIHEGRIVWLIDGYTGSTTYPLAPRQALLGEPVRYVRNSIKAVVDAATGRVRLFVTDPRDPIVRTYGAMFPGLLEPLSAMPAGLRAHLRYSAPLLALQAEVLGSYHMSDARTFYAKEDVWALTTERFRNEVHTSDPVYALLPLPGTDRLEFLLTIPMVSQGRTNLAALLVARNDPPRYGEIRLYEWPRGELVPGPLQIESRIDQDPEISQQLSLWKEGGSEVIRGHLLTIPLDSTLLFLEPLYLEAEQAAIPQLERIILADARRVVMRPTLAEAVEALLTGAPAPRAPQRPGTPTAATVDPGRLARARQLMDRAEAQLRSGDWAGFGQSWAALRQLLGSQTPDRRPPP